MNGDIHGDIIGDTMTLGKRMTNDGKMIHYNNNVPGCDQIRPL